MKKIPSVFKRDYVGTRLVFDEVVPGCEWVLAGEGAATRKFDGTACMVSGGRLFKRYDAKNGKQPPVGFVPAQDPDEKTGHWPGWVPCDRHNPADRYHFEAWDNFEEIPEDGTYELCGPKIQGNPEGCESHNLVPHGFELISEEPGLDLRSFEGLKRYLGSAGIEGIVFHHPDGRMAKIKARDFCIKR